MKKIKIEILKNDKVIKEKVVSVSDYYKTLYQFANIAGGMWNAKDSFNVKSSEI